MTHEREREREREQPWKSNSMATPPRKQQVSLRGASAKEITRDALLEKVCHERELRNYTRRAAAAALFIQKVWRRYHTTKKVARQLQEEWEMSMTQYDDLMTSGWVSSNVLRPFLFFVTCSSTLHQKLQITTIKCMLTCFKTILQSINSTGIAVKNLIEFIATGKSGLYSSVRRYIMNSNGPLRRKSDVLTDDHFLITASAITLALRPFHVADLNINDVGLSDVKDAAEQYCTFLLTVPWLSQCVPAVLLPAFKHASVLSPCLLTLLISKERIFVEMSKLDQSKFCSSCPNLIPSSGWALANIINLATEYDNGSGDSGRFVQGLDCRVYVHSVITISENLLCWLENCGCPRNEENDEYIGNDESSIETADPDILEKTASLGSLKVSYIEAFKPVYQQWHLMKLLAMAKKDFSMPEADTSAANPSFEYCGKLELIDIAFFYSCMLRIFSSFNPMGGSMPTLNMLSFTPGFLVELWRVLEGSFLCQEDHVGNDDKLCKNGISGSHNDIVMEKKQGRVAKDAGNKWTSVLQKITGKSCNDVDYVQSTNSPLGPSLDDGDACDSWDVEPLRRGSQGISKEISCLLHLFCATYAHLLLVLDDIEFYEKQVPFMLEQQRRIASVLNTLVYNGFSHNNGHHNKPLMDAAVRCLHLLYERDCRHRFSPPSLWIAPARKGRPPIAAAARAHEAVTANLRSADALTSPSMGSVITTTPHVFPFEERVQMFREFIKLDKVSRRMAGEVAGPGPGSIEIVVRRDHIVEDGFKQLNFLGSRLKSWINVSFVSECGLPEAGLDYGGLSKEFLTDISRTAFDPGYGLFSQTSTSERCLIPNTAARLVENGMQMIEFLGRVVGKALYEGILLDYSFSLVFVQKLLGRYSFLDELSTLDPELYRNLMYVKHYEGDVRELSLDFTVTEELLGQRVVTELKSGGKNMAVTNENKLQYVHAIADYKLNRQILPLANAFYRGLIDLISPSWLSLFNASEFNQLLSGGKHDFDVDDLRSNTRYTGGYSEGSRTIKLFWEVITGFEPKERCMLLKFVTSCSRAPLLGFKHLQPTFTIHKVACDVPLWAMIGGQDVDRLPSASTCYNTLKLPTYKRPSTLRNKLLYAISSNAGFELS
ncbi:E3 ubiquitin-protein ligase UPL7 isoform X3 [Magnolia sinica]|uniref:E3 ubiquitin-protein ligase UPL7 isoform X3 n=1 Tax=Magnolia sinica TaxID=86752 RepID=UPI00265A3231|nr:E3 ubiquitin-protein ligase UPL7 isoform X3 [Magnolia sinica]